jgi:hypothetical protein
MKILKYLLVSLVLFLQTSLCSAQESVNVLIGPEFQALPCSQLYIESAVSPRSTLGILPSSCNANRSSGLTGPIANESNQFDRVAFDWIYSPKGVFKDGFWFGALTGVEHDNFSTTAGSSADVYFFANALVTGYQWFWKNGFNIRLSFSAVHLTRISLDNYKIAPIDSIDTINWLNTNASSQTHYAYGPAFGWPF